MARLTVPTVRAALVDRFTTILRAAGDADTAVTYGEPGGEVPYRYVAVGATMDSGASRDPVRMTRNATGGSDETYAIAAVIWCLAPGQYDNATHQGLVESGWLVAARLEAGLRASREAWTLGGLVTTAQLTDYDDADFLLDEGRAVEIVCRVSILAARV